jgi:hypothetical protein
MIKLRRMTWGRQVGQMGEKGNAYRMVVEKSEREKPLGRSSHRWAANIKMDLSGGMVSIYLTQDNDRWRTLVNTLMNLQAL